MKRLTFRVGIGVVIGLLAAAGSVLSQVPAPGDPPRPPSLKTVPVPEPANLGDFVKDRQAAIRLGKALFWDMQVGSDGMTACASCHFSSGMADTRSLNSLSPGLKRITTTGAPNPDVTFYKNLGPNGQLSATDFPFFPLSNDVVSSQGVRNSVFLGVTHGPADLTRSEPDPDGFRVGSRNTRRVEPRNTPTVINAVFNHRQFWDGRADNVFNGVNGLGDRDPNARVFRADDPNSPVPVTVRLEDSSLASQAVGPPVNHFEMSAAGRTMQDLGRETRARLTLSASAGVASSPAGAPARAPRRQRTRIIESMAAPGSTVGELHRNDPAAFHPAVVGFAKLIRVDEQGHADRRDRATTIPATRRVHADAVQLRVLLRVGRPDVRGHARGRRFALRPVHGRRIPPPSARRPQFGVDLFRSQTRGRCINCHEGAELTGASVRRVRESPTRIRDGQAMDRGFNNIGVLGDASRTSGSARRIRWAIGSPR